MSKQRAPLSCAVHALTDAGRVRAENQDACHAEPQRGLFLVADGMGGMAAGGVAAKAAVEVLPQLLAGSLSEAGKSTEKTVEKVLKDGIADFSRMLRERAEQDPRLKGTGTTVVLALVLGRSLYVAHLGDSRAYLLKSGSLRLLTEDHTVAALLLKLGKLTPEQAKAHPGRNALTRHAAMAGSASADVKVLRLRGDCRLLLCTDGLTGMLPDERIREVLSREKDREAACRRLVDEANEAGGRDNVTVMVVDLQSPG